MTAQVTDNLPLVSGAPGGIAKLRELILDLAIRGKLVAHEPTDAPVSQLLAEIESARRLIARSKKASAVSEVAPPPFDIPRGWAWIRLGDLLSKIGAGSTPLGGKQAYVDVGVKFLRSQNVWNDGLRLDDVALISAETHARMSGTHVQPGDILFNITGASIGRCALVPDRFDTGNVSQHVTIIRPLMPETRRYLHTALMSKLVQDTVMAVQVGVSREGLSIGKLAQFYVPLPPLAEQHRIVAKVDELMALCDRLEAEQADAEAAHAKLVEAMLASLTQARDADEFQARWQRLATEFQTLFSSEASVDLLGSALLNLAVSGRLLTQHSGDEPAEQLLRKIDDDARDFCAQQKAPRSQVLPVSDDDVPFQAPSGWVWARLGSLFRVITDGDHQAPPQTAQGVAFLTIGNLTNGYLDFERSRSVEPSYFAALAPYRKPAVGDLLYTVVGATYGRPVLVETDRPFCVQRHIAILKRSEFLCAKFALYLLKSPLVYDQASANTTGTAQPTIPLKPLRNLLVPLPPLAEQHRIVAKVTELLALCDQLKARIAAARVEHAQLAEALVAQAVAA